MKSEAEIRLGIEIMPYILPIMKKTGLKGDEVNHEFFKSGFESALRWVLE